MSLIDWLHFWLDYPFNFQYVPHTKLLEYSAQVIRTLLWSSHGSVWYFGTWQPSSSMEVCHSGLEMTWEWFLTQLFWQKNLQELFPFKSIPKMQHVGGRVFPNAATLFVDSRRPRLQKPNLKIILKKEYERCQSLKWKDIKLTCISLSIRSCVLPPCTLSQWRH